MAEMNNNGAESIEFISETAKIETIAETHPSAKLRTHLKKSVGSCAKNRAPEKAEKPCFLLRKIRENSLSFSLTKSRKTIAAKKRKTGATKQYFGPCYFPTQSHGFLGLPTVRTSNTSITDRFHF